MSRWEFMDQLEKLLLYVPIQEREEALQYYNDYFEDAGPENEQEVIAALGSPERVAENIKRDINQNYYGIEPDGVEPGREMVKYHPELEIVEEPMKKVSKGNIPTWAKIVIVVCAAPILFGLLSGITGGIFGILGGIVGVLAAMFITFGLVGLICSVVGIVIVLIGIITSITNLLGGLGLVGVGMLIMAVGILGIMLEVLLVGKWIPTLVKGITHGVRKLLKKG